MGPDPSKTVLVVPVFNHAASLRPLVLAAVAAGCPVLLVDRGSTDGSLDTVADLPVETRRLAGGGGFGTAVRAGAQAAVRGGAEALATMDPDGGHDPADVARLAAAASGSWPAVVVGVPGGDPAAARPGGDDGALSDFLVRLECGKSLPRRRSGLRLYPAAFLAGGRFVSGGDGFGTESLVRAAWAGYPLLFAPVSPGAPRAGDGASRARRFSGSVRRAALHAWLLFRSLVPWPHRRLAAGADGTVPGILEPARLFRRLSREYSSARELAAAVFVGIFIGSLPIIPFGLATIVYVNHRLHLNKLAGAAASNVCVAPFVPFVCMETGYFLRFGRFLYAFDRHTLLDQVHFRLWEWLLGALVVGPVLGLAGALLTYALVRSLRERQAVPAEAARG